MSTWYEKYTNLPYKHLGQNPATGIDCFNLCSLVLKQELGVPVGMSTMDFCNIVDDDWYSKITNSPFEYAVTIDRPDFRWERVEEPEVYDILLMSIGSTNVINHCAMYVDNNKLLQTMVGRSSWISPYGRYYKQYTLGIYRWNGLNNSKKI